MKTLFTLLTAILLYSSALADEPPCWCEFNVKSANKAYSAKVTRVEKDSLKKPWDAQWILSVYKINANDSTKIWSVKYEYDGYTDGVLSNNGQVFAYVNYWYYDTHNIAYIYSQGKKVGQLKGKEFNVPEKERQKTVSHELWLNPKKEYFYFNESENGVFLSINTIDNKTHKIDCSTGKLI